MKQVSPDIEPVMMRIDYEMGFHRNYICDNRDQMYNVLELMFGPVLGHMIYKVLVDDEECIVPYERDRFFEEHKNVCKITAEFNYEFPDSKMPKKLRSKKDKSDELSKPATEEMGQE